MRGLAAGYLAGADPRDPLASPLHADHRGLPPVYIQVGAEKALLDDGRELRFEAVPVDDARARMLADGRPPALVDALLSAAESRSASTLVTSTVADLTGQPPHSFGQWARDHRQAFR